MRKCKVQRQLNYEHRLTNSRKKRIGKINLENEQKIQFMLFKNQDQNQTANPKLNIFGKYETIEKLLKKIGHNLKVKNQAQEFSLFQKLSKKRISSIDTSTSYSEGSF